MSLDKSGGRTQICHARENRRGTSGGSARRGPKGARASRPIKRARGAGGEGEARARTRLVGRDVAPRKHGGAAALYDAPAARGRCLTYPRLAGTQAIFAGLPRNDDTRDVGPDVATPPRRAPDGRPLVRQESLARSAPNCKHVFAPSSRPPVVGGEYFRRRVRHVKVYRRAALFLVIIDDPSRDSRPV